MMSTLTAFSFQATARAIRQSLSNAAVLKSMGNVMKKIDLAYIAGLFDGEGCISISKKREAGVSHSRVYHLRVMVKMANPYLPHLLQFSFGGSCLKAKPRPRRRESWDWSLSAQQASAFLQIILPYLKLKRDEAELAIKFQSAKRKGTYPNANHKRKPPEVLAVEEAQYILMHRLKDKSAEVYGG